MLESKFVCLIVFNATFNNISVISYYWWRKPENPEKTTDLLQVTDKLYHIMLYTEAQGLAVIFSHHQVCIKKKKGGHFLEGQK